MISYRKVCIEFFLEGLPPLQTSPLCTLLIPKSYYTVVAFHPSFRLRQQGTELSFVLGFSRSARKSEHLNRKVSLCRRLQTATTQVL